MKHFTYSWSDSTDSDAIDALKDEVKRLRESRAFVQDSLAACMRNGKTLSDELKRLRAQLEADRAQFKSDHPTAAAVIAAKREAEAKLAHVERLIDQRELCDKSDSECVDAIRRVLKGGE